MKNTLFFLVLTLYASMSQAGNTELSPQQEAVIQHFKKSEKKAKDSLWTANNIFKVGVIDDGTLRNGYAQYVCEVLYDFGFKGKNIHVQIIDIAKLVQTNKWIKLGSAECK